jgi:hypothetical protein
MGEMLGAYEIGDSRSAAPRLVLKEIDD